MAGGQRRQLRQLIPAELGKGFGFLQSKPASALSPVLVTPDALGDAWVDGKLSGVLKVDLNGQAFGRADSGQDMTFDFGTLVAHLAKTRNLGAGTIVGSGTVSNRDSDGVPGNRSARPGYPASPRPHGRDDLDGQPATPFLKPGARPLDARHRAHHLGVDRADCRRPATVPHP